MRPIHFLPLTAAILAVAAGCGGSDAAGSSRTYAGLFVGVYDRAEGAVTVSAAADGSAIVEVFDPTAGSFSGTGTIAPDGAFSAVASRGAQTVAISGRFDGEGASSTFSADLSGAFTVRASGGRRHTGGHAYYQGSYSGVLSPWPGEQASLAFTVDASGAVTGQITDRNVFPETAYDVSGQVNEAGRLTLVHRVGAGDTPATRFEVTGSIYPRSAGMSGGGLWGTGIPGFDPAAGTWASQRQQAAQ